MGLAFAADGGSGVGSGVGGVEVGDGIGGVGPIGGKSWWRSC